MKRCALCESPAKTYCESDQADLCWGCDRKVHGANFLVAKHTRTLLCETCQSSTPWLGSGLKLTPATVSVCGDCAKGGLDRAESRDELGENQGGNYVGYGYSDYDDDDNEGDYDDDIEDEEDDDEEENQVVPWASPPSPASESLSIDAKPNGCFSGGREAVSVISRKRQRDRP